jgi:hypothetical protein
VFYVFVGVGVVIICYICKLKKDITITITTSLNIKQTDDRSRIYFNRNLFIIRTVKQDFQKTENKIFKKATVKQLFLHALFTKVKFPRVFLRHYRILFFVSSILLSFGIVEVLKNLQLPFVKSKHVPQ